MPRPALAAPPAAPRATGPRGALAALRGDPLLRGLARGGAAALAAKLAGAALALAMTAAVARATSPEAFGRFGVAFSLALFASVTAGAGLPVGILRWRPEAEVRGDAALAAAAEGWGLGRTMALAAAAGLALAAAGAALAGWRALGLTAPAALDPAAFLGAGALAPPLAVSAYAAAALRARGATFAALLPRDVAWRGLATAAFAAAAATGAELSAAAALGVAAATLLLLTLLQARATGLGRRAAAPPPETERNWRRQARPLWTASIVAAAQRPGEVTLVGLALGPAEAGTWFAAAAVAQGLGLGQLAANMAIGPLIARAWHGGERAGLRRLLGVAALFTALPTLAAAAAAIVFAPEVLALLGVSPAGDGPRVLALLAAGAAVQALAGPAPLALSLAGAEGAALRVSAGTLAATLAAQGALLPLAGAEAAAAAALTGAAAYTLLARRACLRRLGLDPTLAGALGRGRGGGAEARGEGSTS